MISNPKTQFILLCLSMILLNGYMSAGEGKFSLAAGIGASVVSIPIWSAIGVLLANVGLFFYKIIKPDKKEILTVWQKAGLGLIAGIILKPLFGIGF